MHVSLLPVFHLTFWFSTQEMLQTISLYFKYKFVSVKEPSSIVGCKQAVASCAIPPHTKKLRMKPCRMMLKDCLLFSNYRGFFHLIWFLLRLNGIKFVVHHVGYHCVPLPLRSSTIVVVFLIWIHPLRSSSIFKFWLRLSLAINILRRIYLFLVWYLRWCHSPAVLG